MEHFVITCIVLLRNLEGQLLSLSDVVVEKVSQALLVEEASQAKYQPDDTDDQIVHNLGVRVFIALIVI
jgi:hypothetical protein